MSRARIPVAQYREYGNYVQTMNAMDIEARENLTQHILDAYERNKTENPDGRPKRGRPRKEEMKEDLSRWPLMPHQVEEPKFSFREEIEKIFDDSLRRHSSGHKRMDELAGMETQSRPAAPAHPRPTRTSNKRTRAESEEESSSSEEEKDSADDELGLLNAADHEDDDNSHSSDEEDEIEDDESHSNSQDEATPTPTPTPKPKSNPLERKAVVVFSESSDEETTPTLDTTTTTRCKVTVEDVSDEDDPRPSRLNKGKGKEVAEDEGEEEDSSDTDISIDDDVYRNAMIDGATAASAHFLSQMLGAIAEFVPKPNAAGDTRVRPIGWNDILNIALGTGLMAPEAIQRVKHRCENLFGPPPPVPQAGGGTSMPAPSLDKAIHRARVTQASDDKLKEIMDLHAQLDLYMADRPTQAEIKEHWKPPKTKRSARKKSLKKRKAPVTAATGREEKRPA